MSERIDPLRLQDGTLIRHNVVGYEGKIDGITEIKTCFTVAGEILEMVNTKQIFQYRVAVEGGGHTAGCAARGFGNPGRSCDDRLLAL